MKISIITPVFPPYHGGIGMVAYHHARLLCQRGHSVTVFTPQYAAPGRESNVSGKFTLVPVPPLLSFGNAAFLPRLVKLLEKSDTIFLHYPFFGGAEFALKARKKQNSSRLITLYHMDTRGRGWRKYFFSLYKKIYLKKLFFLSDRIIVTSDDYARHSDIQGYYRGMKERFRVIPNGVDTEHFAPGEKKSEILKKLGIRDEKIIVFVGALDRAHYFKGVDILLKSAKNLKVPYKVLIVGKGELKSQYEKLALALGISENVAFFDSVSSEALPEYYRLADVVALPSVDATEAFGMVLIEAMSCGIPVIASDLPGVRSVVENSLTGILVKPRDPRDLTDALHTIFTHPEIWIRMSQAGRAKALALYDWGRIAAQIEAVLKELY